MVEVIRARIEDLQEIKSTVKSAFYREDKNEIFNEWEFVEKVTKDKGYVEELSLVAVINNKIVGYILLCIAMIGNKEGLTLGPLAVSPDFQNMGIGKQLVNNGLKQAKVLGYEWVALIGGDYYFQFGFESASQYNIILSENNPENEFLKIIFLNKTNKDKVNDGGNKMIKYTIEKGTKEELDLIDDEIIKYNLEKAPFTQEPPFVSINRVLKDDEGNIIAGIISILYCWKCLYIDILWVKEEYRKEGYGSILLNEVEKVAKEQGCNLVHLDTFDFQAKDFYLRHGYEIFGELDNCPAGHKRYFMSKNL